MPKGLESSENYMSVLRTLINISPLQISGEHAGPPPKRGYRFVPIQLSDCMVT